MRSMKKYISFYLSLFCIILLLPFLATVFLSGTKVCTLFTDWDEERYLPLLLSVQIRPQAPQEALKAQAVLARTNLHVRGQEGSIGELYQEILDYYNNPSSCRKLVENYAVYLEAVNATSEILTYQNKVFQVPYHAVSNGKTRDGAEVFHDAAHDYLVSVESPQDIQSEDYAGGCYFEKEFGENLEILKEDSAGYVLEIKADGSVLSGEEIRQQLDLPSSSFTVQMVEDNARIMCKGKGHGLGLSQYGAEILAEQGENYIEILQYYFPLLEISLIFE